MAPFGKAKKVLDIYKIQLVSILGALKNGFYSNVQHVNSVSSWVQMGVNGCKWTQMGARWRKVAQSGAKWRKMVQIGAAVR